MIGAIVVGMVVNGGLIQVGSRLVPPPEGVDVESMESLAENIHLFSPANFVFPFLAHALGTLAGAFIAAKFSVSYHRVLAISMGAFFLIGGAMMVSMLPAPMWFNVLDLLVAYIPMGYLGWKLSGNPVTA